MFGSSQSSCVYFIHYPRSLDAIRFVIQQMQQHVLRNLLCDQNDEEALYYCPPRTVTRKTQVGYLLRQKSGAWEIQPTSSGSNFWRNTATGETRWTSPYAAKVIEEEAHIGCANSRDSERRCKRYTYLEYMNARVQVRNIDTGADEWRHYCPWCLKFAETRSKQTGGIVDGSLLSQLKKYTGGAAVSVEDLDEVLRPIRLLLADLNPDHLFVIPVDSNGMLFEDAMDKFETEQRDRVAENQFTNCDFHPLE